VRPVLVAALEDIIASKEHAGRDKFRATMDLDVCVPWARENFERLAAALNELGARLDLPPDLADVEVPATRELLETTSMTRRCALSLVSFAEFAFCADTPTSRCRISRLLAAAVRRNAR
jgi:hypothetical protein